MNFKPTILLATASMLFLAMPASAQDSCDAKELSFAEFAACAKQVKVKETQGMCLSGTNCMDGSVAVNIVTEVEGGSSPTAVEAVAPPVEISTNPIASATRTVNEEAPVLVAPISSGYSSTPTMVAEATETVVEPARVIAPTQPRYPARVMFESGSAKLQAASNGALDEIYAVMIADPSISLDIEGHASADGDEFFNLALSSKRAEAVTNALIARGVPSQRLTHQGFGEYRLKNTAIPTSYENRRVEMVLNFSTN